MSNRKIQMPREVYIDPGVIKELRIFVNPTFR